LQDLSPEDKARLIDVLIDYIFLNFKKLENVGMAQEEVLEDNMLLERRAKRKK